MNKFFTKFSFSASALLPVLLLGVVSPDAVSDESEPAIYGCKQCVQYTGWLGEIDFGFSYVNNDSLKFGDYRGLEKEGTYGELNGYMHYRSLEGNFADIYAENLAHESRILEMRGGNRGFYEVRFGWQEIPKYRGYGAETPFIGSGGQYLTLPDNWVKANTTFGMTALHESLVPEELKTLRKNLNAGATFKMFNSLTYRFDYQRQQKEGTRPLSGGMFYSNASILPAPVNFVTDIVDMDLTWSGKRAQFQVGFLNSDFKGGYRSLTWQNPFASQDIHDTFRAALEPSNSFQQFNASAAIAITERIKLTGQAAVGSMKQDDPFIPYTINPRYSDLPLPRESLDGKVDVDTYNFTGKLFARLNNKLSFTARGKWDERENKTPVDMYTPVITDLLPFAPRYNRPYGYKRENYSADLRYRPTRALRVSAGARQENIDRTLQAVETTKERTWWGEFKISPSYKAELRVKMENAQRELEDYQQPMDGGPVDHPLLRKFHLADRDHERWLVDLDLMPGEAWGINLSYMKAKAEYEESQIGLQNSDDASMTVNVNYTVGPKLNLYGFYTRDEIDANMLNTTGGDADPWSAVTSDTINTYGLGVSSEVSEKSSFGIDYVSSVSKGEISVQTGQEAPFEPLRTDLESIKLYFDYKINDHWGYKLYAEQEKYSSEDWQIDAATVDGIGAILSMGQISPDYKVWYYRFQLSYRF
jgi:MtrB/PioB family decaheme-associated outer membrane protein